MIAAVLFDLFHTLVYFEPKGSEKNEREIVRFLKSKNPKVTVGYYRTLRKKYHERITTGKLSLTEANKLILVDLCVDSFNLNTFDNMVQNSFKENLRVYPEAKQVLTSLKADGLKLGLVTNCGEGVRADLKEKGLELFDSYALSTEVGVRKPDPKIYLKVTKELGISPQDCIFVSDEISGDLLGAFKLGMRTIHLQHKDKWGMIEITPDEELIRPDASVDNLIDVLSIIKEWG